MNIKYINQAFRWGRLGAAYGIFRLFFENLEEEGMENGGLRLNLSGRSQKLEYNFKRNMKMNIVALSLMILGAFALSCEPGSVPNSLSICIQPRYMEGCHSYKNEFTCQQCDYRYVLNKDSGLCEMNAQTTEDCCATRGADGSCLRCKAGLYMVNGKCQESNILGCLEKDNLGKCINCASGFFLRADGCVLTVKNCVKFSDQQKQTCANCAQGYSLYNNICVMNSILGCKNEVEHVCKECYSPFKLESGDCKIQNCKTYNDYKCVACECGYFLAEQGVCKRIQTGCVRYQRGQCTDCLPNFRLKGNDCQIEGCLDLKDLKCTRCEENYELFHNGCVMKNCQSWKDGSCETCVSGFNMRRGLCISSQNLSSQ